MLLKNNLLPLLMSGLIAHTSCTLLAENTQDAPSATTPVATGENPLVNVKPYIVTRANIACSSRRLDELDKYISETLTRHRQYIHRARLNVGHPVSQEQGADLGSFDNLSAQALEACSGSVWQTMEKDCTNHLNVLNAFAQFLDVKWKDGDKDHIKDSRHILSLPDTIVSTCQEIVGFQHKIYDNWSKFIDQANDEVQALRNRHQEFARVSTPDPEKWEAFKQDVKYLKISLEQSKRCNTSTQLSEFLKDREIDAISASLKPVEEFLAQQCKS